MAATGDQKGGLFLRALYMMHNGKQYSGGGIKKVNLACLNVRVCVCSSVVSARSITFKRPYVTL